DRTEPQPLPRLREGDPPRRPVLRRLRPAARGARLRAAGDPGPGPGPGAGPGRAAVDGRGRPAPRRSVGPGPSASRCSLDAARASGDGRASGYRRSPPDRTRGGPFWRRPGPEPGRGRRRRGRDRGRSHLRWGRGWDGGWLGAGDHHHRPDHVRLLAAGSHRGCGGRAGAAAGPGRRRGRQLVRHHPALDAGRLGADRGRRRAAARGDRPDRPDRHAGDRRLPAGATGAAPAAAGAGLLGGAEGDRPPL
ncbi:MAG: hypothetical protein AVDCRST_MAG59-3385, partial [uncultured Thermomicrobiales bacterium]